MLANPWWQGMTLLSGGTDGEDGPTDAAGAMMTEAIVRAALSQNLDPRPYLERNDAYSFFQQLDALLITGPTHTNVCDVRVMIVKPANS
jgi:glycerate-2-kinase